MKNQTKMIAAAAAAAFIAAIVLGAVSCATIPNPETQPVVKVTVPDEPWAPDPDAANETLTLHLECQHPAPITEWSVQVLPVRQRQGGQQQERTQERTQERVQRAPFYEQTFTTAMPPKVEWTWNAKSNAPDRNGELVQSATDYRIILTTTDQFGNTAAEEGILSIGIIVNRDASGDLRMVVSDIAFPPNSADLSQVSDEDRRANQRVLRFVAGALNKYTDYTVTIEGRTNPTTPPDTPERAAEDNEPLSEQRAGAVLDWLVTNGNIDRTRMKAVGMGGTRTVAPWDDPEENQKNRRVEFILHK